MYKVSLIITIAAVGTAVAASADAAPSSFFVVVAFQRFLFAHMPTQTHKKTTQCTRVSDKSVPIDVASSIDDAHQLDLMCVFVESTTSWSHVDVRRTVSVNVRTDRWQEGVTGVVLSYPYADIWCG